MKLHEILTNEIGGKVSPATTLNHIMHVCIKALSQYAIKHFTVPFRV